jgi:hypothetical protein
MCGFGRWCLSCNSYQPREKPPKILGRYLLGPTQLGSGAIGKVKEAIDIFTLRRQVFVLISAFVSVVLVSMSVSVKVGASAGFDFGLRRLILVFV